MYTPDITHPNRTKNSTPRTYVDNFLQSVILRFHLHDKTHHLTLNKRVISDRDIVEILLTYNSPLILTIDGSITPSPIQQIYPPHQS